MATFGAFHFPKVTYFEVEQPHFRFNQLSIYFIYIYILAHCLRSKLVDRKATSDADENDLHQV